MLFLPTLSPVEPVASSHLPRFETFFEFELGEVSILKFVFVRMNLKSGTIFSEDTKKSSTNMLMLGCS